MSGEYVYVCVGMCVYSCSLHIYMFYHVHESQRSTLCMVPHEPLLGPFCDWPINLPSRLDWLASEPQRSVRVVLVPPSFHGLLGLQVTPPYPAFLYMGSGESNSRLAQQSTFLTEPSPQPCNQQSLFTAKASCD